MTSGANHAGSSIFEVKDRHEADLRALPNVTGVGVGPSSSGSGLAIKLYIDPAADGSDLPTELDGHPIEIERLAPLRKQ